MKKIFILVIFSLFSFTFFFAETFDIIINKDTYYVDEINNNLERLKKETLITVNCDNAEISRSNNDEEGTEALLYIDEKGIYLKDIFVNNNSECLPKGIIGTTYTMNYYLEDIFNKEIPAKLFVHEPYLIDFWNREIRNDGEYYRDFFFPYSLKFFNYFYIEDEVFYSPYTRNPLFIKNIEKTDNEFIIYIIPMTYSKNTLPIYNNVIDSKKINKLIFKFDGDYLFIYKNNKLIFKLVKTNEDTLFQIRNFYLNKQYDISKIMWPKYADGSCDYDGSKTTATIQTGKVASSTNVTQNKTMTVSENLKLRSGEATSTQVLTIMSAGTKVKILELGKAETIDGISSNWVKVEVQVNSKDRDGKTIKAGTVGWCYGGYLK